MSNPVKRTRAEITQPLPNPDKPYKFTFQFPVKIHIEADIFNSSDTNNLAIEVRKRKKDQVLYFVFIFIVQKFILPDQSSSIFWPAPGSFKQTTPYCYKLSTDIQLTLSPWTGKNIFFLLFNLFNLYTFFKFRTWCCCHSSCSVV